LEASNINIAEKIPASRKLQRDDALALIANATTLTVAKGKKVQTFSGSEKSSEAAVTAMLGSTGNLRAPTIVAGSQLLVGFNEDVYAEVFA
jgi:arsenate reductase-like glutaredoxin family protein